MPEWIVSAIQARKTTEYSAGPSPSDAGKRERAYAERALTNAANKVAASPRGSWNTELNTAAFCMGTLIARGWIGAATVEGRLHDAARACGLFADDGERAARSTIKSGIEAGTKEPHADLPNREWNPAEPPERETAKQDPSTWHRGTFSAPDLQTMEFPPFAWIVQDILPAEGAALLCSRPKFGKSWLALDLCLGCAADRFILGTIKPRQGDVLYLALEDSKRRLQRRMTKLLPFGSKWSERLRLTTEWRRLHEGGLEDIRAWHDHTKEKGGKPILVVVDVLAKVRKPTRPGTPQYEADYEALTGITKLANELGIAILVVHHVRKMQADDLMEMVSGTYGITGAVDTILVMANKPSGTVLDIRGRDAEQAELAIEFEKLSCRWRILGDAAEVHLSEQQSKILAALRQAGEPLGAADLEKITEIKRDTLGKALYRLANEGTIKRVGRGLYAMPEWQPPPEGPKAHSGKSGKPHRPLPDSLPESNPDENIKKNDTSGKSGSSGSLSTPSTVAEPAALPVQTLPEVPEVPEWAQAADKTAEFETPKSGNGKRALPELPDLPACLRRAPKGGHPAEGLPPGQAMARVFVREIWPPSLGPEGDDVFDIDPRWRQ